MNLAQNRSPAEKANIRLADWDEDVLPSGQRLLWWLLLGVFGVTGLIFCFVAQPLFYPQLKPGDVAYKDFVATQTVEVEDKVATEQQRTKARQELVPIFKRDTSQQNKFIPALQTELVSIKYLQARMASPKKNANRTAFNTSDNKLQNSEFYIASNVSQKQFDNFAHQLTLSAQKVNNVLPRFPVEDNALWQEAIEEFLPQDWPTELKSQAAILVCQLLSPNLVIDEEATQRKALQLMSSLKPVMKTIEPGTILLKKGETVSQDNIEYLESAGTTGSIRWPFVLSLALSVIACTGLVGIYLYNYRPHYLFSLPSLGLIFTVSIAICALAMSLGKTLPQFVPLPAAALILTVFFGRRTALIITLSLIILLAVDKAIDSGTLLALTVASGAGVLAYSRQRHDLVFVGLLIGIGQALGYIASLTFAQQALATNNLPALGKAIIFEFAGGITSAIICIGSLPFLEHLFGLLTPFRLAELVNSDQPLLRTLEAEAPGTYQHSLAVANLAEAGARAIGADSILCRAGALYHDLGKAANSKYFIENQLGDKNPHDAISPEESREKVLAHVRDGVDMAIRHGLPKAIRDFIPMHQGTSLMAYFYHKACERDGVDNVDPNAYRYPGPKPHSKETAIVMLADVSEAVTHSMKDPSEEEIDQALTKVLENRYQDGQLNQSTLTYKELQQVKTAFVRVWRTLHHDRLKYPTTTTGRMPMPPQTVTPKTSNRDVDQ